MKIKHTIEESGGIYILHVNGTPSECPFRAPAIFPVPGLVGGPPALNIVASKCSSQCPHFKLNSEGSLSLNCSSSKPTVIEISK